MLAKKPKGATAKKQSNNSFASLLWMFMGAILTLMLGLALYLFNPLDMHTEEVAEKPTGVQPINAATNEREDPTEYEFYELLPQQEITSIPDEAMANDAPVGVSALEPDVVVTLPPETAVAVNTNAENPEQPVANPNQRDENNGENPDNVNRDDVTETRRHNGDNGHDNMADNVSAPDNDAIDNNNEDGMSSIVNARQQEATPAANVTYILQINSFGNATDADKRRAQVLMAGVDASVVIRPTADGQPVYQVVSAPMRSQNAVQIAQQRLQNNGIDSLIVEQRR